MSSILERVDQKTQMVGLNRMELLLFRLSDDQLYGINVFKVREVIRTPHVTEIPRAQPCVLGVSEIRNETIPIIDLSEALGKRGLNEAELSASYTIQTEFNSSIQGFVVKLVDRIVHMQWKDIYPPPSMFENSNYLTGITKVDEELIQILDVEKVLAEVMGIPDDLTDDVLEEIEPLELHDLAGDYKVLIADDSDAARKIIKGTVEKLGLDCVVTNNGYQAYQWLKRRKTELEAQGKTIGDEILMVITDIEMPEMDGYTLTKEIRSSLNLKNLFVLIHSSLSGGFNDSLVKKVGANGFVPKWHQDQLAAQIVAQIERVKDK